MLLSQVKKLVLEVTSHPPQLRQEQPRHHLKDQLLGRHLSILQNLHHPILPLQAQQAQRSHPSIRQTHIPHLIGKPLSVGTLSPEVLETAKDDEEAAL